MSPLVAPVLAQLITLGTHDRVEARYVRALDHRYEATMTPGAQLTFAWPRYDLSLGYDANLLLTPLETKPRELYVYQNANVSTSYRFRRTTLTLNSSVSWGSVNFQVQALRDPTAPPAPSDGADNPGQTPAQPGAPQDDPVGQDPGAPAAPGGAVPPPEPVDREVKYAASTTQLNVEHRLTRELNLGAFANYTTAGGTNREARRLYPWTRGYLLGARGAHMFRWTAKDSFVSALLLQRGWSSNGNVLYSAEPTETWLHAFTPRTVSSLQAGLSVTRYSQDDGLVAYSVFPNFAADITHQELLARGNLTLMAGVRGTPALDTLRATIDPRLSVTGAIGWQRERFFTGANGSAAVSIASADANAGAFDTYQATFLTAYRATDWLGLEAGARVYEQQYQGVTSVPLGYAIYVAVDLGYVFVIRREKPAVPAAVE